MPNQLLSRPVGFRLYSVQFVIDYVQLRFDGPTDEMPCSTATCYPAVSRPTGVIAPGEFGHSDALVALIPGEVVRTNEATGTGLRIELTTGAIVLPPDA